jgi:hypothetical protein
MRLQVLDESTAPFPNVLVVIKYLKGGGETGRYLSDSAGRIPTLNLKPGLHRFVLTCPYGICKTTIFEFLDTQVSGEVALEVPFHATDRHGISIGAPKAQLAVVLSDGRPYAKELVLIRNTDVSRERWYRTDEEGEVEVELPDDPMVAVIVHRERVFRYSLAKHCPAPSTSTYVDLECHVLARGPIVLRLP